MKIKTIIILLITIIAAVLFTFYIIQTLSPRNYINKHCKTDKECGLISLSCCPDCDHGLPINKYSKKEARWINKFRCLGLRCPPMEACISTTSLTEGILVPESVCKDEKCVFNWKINCEEYCQQLDEGDMDIIENVKEKLNMSKEELNEKCVCGK